MQGARKMKQAAYRLEHERVAPHASMLPPPVISFLVGKRRWRLEHAYALNTQAHTIVVPAHFEFDLASVPRALWWLIAPFELSIAAPLVHDFLYHCAGQPPAGCVRPPKRFTRLETDAVFRETMDKEGVSQWRCAAAYRAVRCFGMWSWGRDSD